MSQELANMVFGILNRRIDEEVECTAWQFGVPVVHEGVLENVVDFDQIVVDKTVIPFVGNGVAIEKIALKSDGRLIYTNPNAVGYHTKDTMGVILAQEEMLGYSVLRHELTDSPKKTLAMK